MTVRQSFLGFVLLSLCMGTHPCWSQSFPELPSKTITLSEKEISLKNLADSFREQTGLTLDLGKQNPDRRITLDWQKKPFWEALEAIGKQTRCRVEVTGSGLALVELVESDSENLSVIRGPFRLTPSTIHIRRNLTTLQSTGNLTMELAWEPSVLVFRSDSIFRASEAKTDSGTPVRTDSSATRYLVEGRTAQLNLNFSQVARAAQSISFKGEVHLTISRNWIVHQLNPSNGKLLTPQDANVILNVKKWSKTGNDLTVDIAYEYPKDVVWESFENPFERNTLELISPSGKVITPSRSESQQNETRYIFKGTVGELGPDWKVQYRLPRAFEEIKIPFEFRNIPLP